MNKLSKIINDLSQEDLLKIKRDLVAGNVDKLVEKRLRDFQKEKYSNKHCPICEGVITEDSLVIEFGKSYLRKKAYFDGADCLVYFINSKLKEEPHKRN